jgi:SDR family mycofactocin-dependent oxidoreductase
MGRVEGKVALVTGAARGLGRSHAVRLAQEGASIIAVDACADVDTVPYALATKDDLAETAKLVEAEGAEVHSAVADVRDLAALTEAVAAGVEALGGLDVVVANAGISSYAPAWELTEEQWQDLIDVNLTGVWKTIKATVPTLLERGKGGSIIVISSVGGVSGMLNIAHYVAAKHGVTGLMRTLSAELAPFGIRVNSVHPTTARTPLVENDAAKALVTANEPNATWDDAKAALQLMNALPVPWVEPIDVSNAVLYLASDEARLVTGSTHMVDAGATNVFKMPHDIAEPG